MMAKGLQLLYSPALDIDHSTATEKPIHLGCKMISQRTYIKL